MWRLSRPSLVKRIINMQIVLITLFPKMFYLLKYGVIGRALERRLLTLSFWNPRDYTSDPHRTVDDRPYGGGPGMVMKFEPLQAALKAAKFKCVFCFKLLRQKRRYPYPAGYFP